MTSDHPYHATFKPHLRGAQPTRARRCQRWPVLVHLALTVGLAATAAAQPTEFVDLGVIGCDGGRFNIASPGNTVLWCKLVLPPTPTGVGTNTWVDIFAASGPDTITSDPLLALYDAAGNLVAFDDDDGPALMSELTFGQTLPLHQNGPLGGEGANGRDGPLTGGVYWLAASLYRMVAGPNNWAATSSANVSGWIDVRINATHSPCSPPLGGVGVAIPPSTTSRNPVLIRVTGFTGVSPTSTFLAPASGASVDATSLGLGVIQLFDDGNHNDAIANDGIWARSIVIPDVTDRAYELPFTLVDDQGRRGTGHVILSVVPCGEWVEWGGGVNGVVLDIERVGSSDIVIGGRFTQIGGVAANNVARWNGTSWAALGDGFPAPQGHTPFFRDLAVGTNNSIVACGYSTTGTSNGPGIVAEWNGSVWTQHFAPTDGRAYSLLCEPDGTFMAGGSFTSAGGTPVNRIAQWSDSGWTPLGTGMGDSLEHVDAMLRTTGGPLVAGGHFTFAGGIPASNVAQWDGTEWHALGRGLAGGNNSVDVLRELPDGSIIAGGTFTAVSGLSGHAVSNIARWNGVSWNALGAGLNSVGGVQALAVLPNGDIVAGGYFTASGSTPLSHVARWNGRIWIPLGPGMNDEVFALHVLPDGSLLAGGEFTTAGGIGSPNLARWVGVEPIDQVTGPLSAFVRPMSQVSFAVAPVGGGTKSYRWRHDGQVLSDGETLTGSVVAGSSTDTLSLTLLGEADAGEYTCEVSNACNRMTSLPATLSLACPADLDGSEPGYPDDAVNIDDLLYFLVSFEAGAAVVDVDDDGDPAFGRPDGGVTIDDLLYFLAHFELGC